MTVKDLKVNGKYWCWWKSRYIYYNGRAFNAKDYEFVDIADNVITLNKSQVENLESRA